MGSAMICKLSDNIVSPLGMTTDENFKSILAGRTGLRMCRGTFGLREEFCASLFDREAVSVLFEQKFGSDKDFTFFEKLCILSAYDALNSAVIDSTRRGLRVFFDQGECGAFGK